MNELSDPSTWLTQYGDTLYRHAYFRLGDSMAAEEMVQETLLAALQAQSKFSGKSSEKTWLIGILKHKIIDYLRKAVREQPIDESITDIDVLLRESFDQKGHWKINIESWSHPEKSLEQQQFWETLESCLCKLPQRQRSLFILREIDGLSSEEVCKELDISSTNNLWTMLSRMRMRLRECLNQHWFNR